MGGGEKFEVMAASGDSGLLDGELINQSTWDESEWRKRVRVTLNCNLALNLYSVNFVNNVSVYSATLTLTHSGA
jgi:hypothetical protein